MADQGTPGKPADLATTTAILGALVHLTERLTGAGHPVAPPRHHEPKQVRRPSGPARDHKGKFRKRQ